MNPAPRISLVVPAFNEVDNLEAVVRAAERVLGEIVPAHEIVVVDDGSTDGTEALLARLAAELPALRTLRHPQNRGYGAALRSGFAASRGDWIAFVDGDGQFDPGELARLWPPPSGVDVVTGFRRRRRDPPHRVLYARLYGWLVRRVLGVRVRDVNCGLKLLSAELLRGLPLTSTGALINAEVYAHAARQGRRIEEVAVEHLPRRAGRQTGGNPAVILRMFRELLALRRRLREPEPGATPEPPSS